MANALSDVDGSILDCQKSIEEFDNAILDLHTEIFNRIHEQFSNLDSELESLGGLFDGSDTADEQGNWTKEGIAQLGLLTQQYELAQYQIQQYNQEIDELNRQYMSGKYSATEYADRLAELSSAQWDSVNSSESIKDAIMDLNEARIDLEIKGIEKEIDAYKELTDAQIETLRADKDLHDYRKSIEDTVKSKESIEKRIAAMEFDNSASAIAQKAKLREQLAEITSELEEKQYDHSIEAQENALNKQYEDFETEKNNEIESLRASLEQRELLIAQSFETVKQNAGLVGQQIAQATTEHGITVSNALISAWNQGGNAIAGYGTVLSAESSAFISNIIGVENEVWNLQYKADETAGTLAYMFSTQADNLVNELAGSYYAEDNLNAMTNALQNSLINTLERGYDVSGITSSLNAIADAASKAGKEVASLGNAEVKTPDFSDLLTDDVGKNVGKMNNSGNYRLIDKMTGKVYKDGLTYAEALKLREDKNVHRHTTIEKYASGTRSTKGSLIVTDEEGCELKLPKLADGQYTIADEGMQILTKAQTDNIFDWSKFNPVDFIQPRLNLELPKLPETVGRNTQPSVNMHYDSLITINGDVNDTNHFTKQVNKQILESWKQFSNGIRK